MFNEWKIKKFNEYILVEQVISRSDAESGISHIAGVIIEHLLKCLIFGPNCSAYNHWVGELDKWFKQISQIKLKPKSYHPALKDVKVWAREEPLEDLRSYFNNIRVIVFEEKEFLPIGENLLKNNFSDFCNFYDSILVTCCNKPTYTIDILQEKLNDWFKRYGEIYKD